MATEKSFPGFSAPAAGTAAPLEMLTACHDRAARQLGTLRRLVAHLAGSGADAQAQSAAVSVMRYFDLAARDHHADEEEDLFPALLESMAGSDAVCLIDITRALAADHRALESAWARVRAVLVKVAAGEAALLGVAEVEALAGGYERHIAREEQELLPMAERLLGPQQLDDIGAAMRARRGIARP